MKIIRHLIILTVTLSLLSSDDTEYTYTNSIDIEYSILGEILGLQIPYIASSANIILKSHINKNEQIMISLSLFFFDIVEEIFEQKKYPTLYLILTEATKKLDELETSLSLENEYIRNSITHMRSEYYNIFIKLIQSYNNKTSAKDSHISSNKTKIPLPKQLFKQSQKKMTKFFTVTSNKIKALRNHRKYKIYIA